MGSPSDIRSGQPVREEPSAGAFRPPGPSPTSDVRRRFVADRLHEVSSDVESETFQSQAGSPIRRSIHEEPRRTVQRVTPAKRAGSPNADGMPAGARRQFQQLEMARNRIANAARLAGGIHEETLLFMQEQVRIWRERCWICAQEGKPDGHELYHCTEAISQDAKEWWFMVREGIHYQRCTACFGCGLPPALCEWSRKPSQCPNRGVMMSMIAMMVYGLFGRTGQRIRHEWRGRLQAHGVDDQEGEQMREFFTTRYEGREEVMLGHEFVWLRRKWIEDGERGG